MIIFTYHCNWPNGRETSLIRDVSRVYCKGYRCKETRAMTMKLGKHHDSVCPLPSAKWHLLILFIFFWAAAHNTRGSKKVVLN